MVLVLEIVYATMEATGHEIELLVLFQPWMLNFKCVWIGYVSYHFYFYFKKFWQFASPWKPGDYR
jgi:hypothetical protein